MAISNQQILVTGGAGFIGSHLTKRLVEMGCKVSIIDNFSNSNREEVVDGASVIHADLTDQNAIKQAVSADFDLVIHLAARKDPNDNDPQEQFAENTTMTHQLLNICKDAGIEKFVFASSSTVYGEAPRPTPEDYAPLEPISAYGAAKLGGEGLVSTYAHSYEMTGFIFRFANIVGPGLRGAVIPDFIERIQSNPDSLKILGNGRQEKSYMHVDDCVDAMLHVIDHVTEQTGPVYTFNLGTRTTTSVRKIAEIVCDTMGVDPTFEYTGGDRGWDGDVPKMRLSIEKIAVTGWNPNIESTVAVQTAAEELVDEI